MHISILTDDPVLHRMLTLELRRQGLDTADGAALCVVDLDHAPFRPHPSTPVIGLTHDPEQVAPQVKEQLFALLALPLSVRELSAVLSRLPRRCTASVEQKGNRLWLNGVAIDLSTTESLLMRLLYENRHRVVTNEELNALLGDSATRTNTLAVFMHRLRRKLSFDGVIRIRTLRQKGYQWIENEVTV